MFARPRLIVLVAVGALFVGLFAPALCEDRLFAFRDVADFYYPLFQAVQAHWSAGNVPLWNPGDNLGMPLAASPTASVWYPGKLLFLLPLGFDWNYKLYILLHVLLAAATLYRLARHWRASEIAAGGAALAYAFGGNVLYQYTNVVFLIGAAWMPCALLTADHIASGRYWRGTSGLAMTLALMILGGDPQSAYHAALLAGAYLGWGTRTKPLSLLSLLAAGLFTALLSAIQLLPAWEFSAHSERAVTTNARSLYEIPQALRHAEPGRHIADGLLCRFNDDCPHHEMVYEFSVGPWRMAEFLWPNFSGRQFPEHHRWLDVLPDERQIWVPSLYLGLLPLVLGLSQFCLWRGTALTRYLSGVLVVAVLASFGTFGLGWLARQIAGWFGASHAVAAALGDPVGGVYWFLTVLLPGYVQFRYPAKWMTVVAMALSLLAARGWDAAFDGASQTPLHHSLRRWFRRLAWSSLAAAAGLLMIRPWWHAWLAGAIPNPMFGPLDTQGAAHDLLWAFLQCGLLAFIFARQFRHCGSNPAWTGLVCLVLLVVDLAAANGWMIVTAPAELWHTPPRLARHLASATNEAAPVAYPPRVYRHWIWLPGAWQRTASPERLVEAVRWNRATLAPQHHLTFGISQAETYGTLMYGDFRFLIQAAERAVGFQPGDDSTGWIATPLADLLGVEYAIGPEKSSLGKVETLELKTLGLSARDDVQIGLRARRQPRAWIVHEVDVRVPLADPDPAAMAERAQEVLRLAASPATALQRAIVETSTPFPPAQPATPADAAAETCRLECFQANRIALSATLARPGLVILGEQYDPNWTVTVQSDGRPPQTAELLRTNRVLRGVWLPAGQHRLVYDYRPRSFQIGALVSGLAWLGFLLGVAVSVVQSRRRMGGN